MKKTAVLILACMVCGMLIAAGCTSTSGTTPATPVATTAALSSEAPSWAGTWNSSYNTDKYGVSVMVLTFTQTGTSVTGTYHDDKGTLKGDVMDGTLTGTWNDSDINGTYSGFFVFEQAPDGKSFTGRWVNTAEGADALKTTANFWNAELVPATTTTQPAAGTKSWSGDWNTTWLESNGNLTVSSVSFVQDGSEVTGTYAYTYPGEKIYTGVLNATVQGNKIAGTYSETDSDTGLFEFELSADQDSFTGRWAHASEGSGALANSTLFWNGVRL